MIKRYLARRRSDNPPSVATTPRGQWRVGAHRVSTLSVTDSSALTSNSFTRFLWIFTIFGLIVVVVVIGFLIGIVRALESIDNGLFTASNSVTGATSNVQPLPNYIQTINSALSDIDTDLKPIRGQVADATASLVSIRGTAQRIDASLKDTSQSLVNTSGSLVDISGTLAGASQSTAAVSDSLVDTSNVLLNVLGLAQSIDGTLESIQHADSRGTALVTPQVKNINSALIGAEIDLSSINLQLQETNRHLTNICMSPTLSLLPPFKCRP
jgi:methyl-accepting chemotaxis protein